MFGSIFACSIRNAQKNLHFISDDLQYSLSSNLNNAGGKQKSLSVISLTSFLKISCVP